MPTTETSTRKWFYHEKNKTVIDHPVNKTFEEVLWMSEDEFYQWILDMRKVIADAWDNEGLPPKVGPDHDEIVSQFKQLVQFNVTTLEREGGTVLRNTHTNLGMAVNSWFPTMMKTTINNPYGSYDGKSIYSHFVDDTLIPRCVLYGHRHFKRDSFYAYSKPIFSGQRISIGGKPHLVESCREFITWFEENRKMFGETHGYWLKPRMDQEEYSGYAETLHGKQFLTISLKEVEELGLPDIVKTNLTLPDGSRSKVDEENLQVMFFELGQRIFPVGFKAFRISWCQVPVNYPPLTARYIYEKYTERLKHQRTITVYDPSMGWGGRIIGAMAVNRDRHIHYVGTDPNTDHNIFVDGVPSTKYENVAKFFNEQVNNGCLEPHENTYELYQLGSEVIHEDPGFQKWKGKLDLAFTSPPYFNREGYSQEETQSYKKFPRYELWRDGFLRRTLQTCFDWLNHDRYLVWNISDLKTGPDTFVPLVDDTMKICNDIGFEFVEELKMIMAQMPGTNRMNTIDENGERVPTARYNVKVDRQSFKYEPILVFRKP